MGYANQVAMHKAIQQEQVRKVVIFIGFSSASLAFGGVVAMIALVSQISAIAICIGGGGIGCILMMKPSKKYPQN